MFTRSPHIYLIASLRVVAALAPGIPLPTAAAQNQLVPAQEAASLLGVEHAQGAVIWSHGRSLQKECSLVPTPDYIAAFRVAGWDTFRLNRPSVTDTLPDSASALASEAEALKRQGYRRVVLAGQSFGGFISLIAAGRSDAIDAVIATAPAAYGSVQSNPGGYGLNASQLYELLGAVRRAHVALFFFDGDIFDPGGRAPIADEILHARGLTHLVVDRPAGLPTHWASISPEFAAQFGSCLVAFAAGGAAGGSLDCKDLEAAAQRPKLPVLSGLVSLPSVH
jgi:pimeloyl-ACP methyl ester carboxylesterase